MSPKALPADLPECQFVTLRGKDGLHYHKAACGLATRVSIGPHYSRRCDRACTRITPPGDRLKGYFDSIGMRGVVTSGPNLDKKTGKACDGCKALQGMMNRLGVAGCRENRQVFLASMRKRYDKIPKLKKVKMLAKAALLAVPAGLAWTLSSKDPLASLYDLAVDVTEREILERNSKLSQMPFDPFRVWPAGKAPEGKACPVRKPTPKN